MYLKTRYRPTLPITIYNSTLLHYSALDKLVGTELWTVMLFKHIVCIHYLISFCCVHMKTNGTFKFIDYQKCCC